MATPYFLNGAEENTMYINIKEKTNDKKQMRPSVKRRDSLAD